MIESSSRDPVTLWSDLSQGWISGQETEWFDEQLGGRFYSYNNLLVCRWDYLAMQTEGEEIRRNLMLKEAHLEFLFAQPDLLRRDFIDSFDFPFGRVDLVKKRSGALALHLYTSVCEFPREFFGNAIQLNAQLKQWKIPPMTPMAFHSTALYFSRTTMPLLLPIFGRRSFLSGELSTYLNKDMDRMKIILSKNYKNKTHQAVWKHVRKMMGDTYDRA